MIYEESLTLAKITAVCFSGVFALCWGTGKGNVCVTTNRQDFCCLSSLCCKSSRSLLFSYVIPFCPPQQVNNETEHSQACGGHPADPTNHQLAIRSVFTLVWWKRYFTEWSTFVIKLGWDGERTSYLPIIAHHVTLHKFAVGHLIGTWHLWYLFIFVSNMFIR